MFVQNRVVTIRQVSLPIFYPLNERHNQFHKTSMYRCEMSYRGGTQTRNREMRTDNTSVRNISTYKEELKFRQHSLLCLSWT